MDQATAEKAAIQAFEETASADDLETAIILVEHESGLVEDWFVMRKDNHVFARLIL